MTEILSEKIRVHRICSDVLWWLKSGYDKRKRKEFVVMVMKRKSWTLRILPFEKHNTVWRTCCYSKVAVFRFNAWNKFYFHHELSVACIHRSISYLTNLVKQWSLSFLRFICYQTVFESTRAALLTVTGNFTYTAQIFQPKQMQACLKPIQPNIILGRVVVCSCVEGSPPQHWYREAQCDQLRFRDQVVTLFRNNEAMKPVSNKLYVTQTNRTIEQVQVKLNAEAVEWFWKITKILRRTND